MSLGDLLDISGCDAGQRANRTRDLDAPGDDPLDERADAEANVGWPKSRLPREDVPVPGGDLARPALPSGDLLREIRIDMLPRQDARHVVEGRQARLARDGQEERIVLGVAIGVGDEDVEDHLIEERERVGRRQVPPSGVQESGEGEARDGADLVFPSGRQTVGLREILLVDPVQHPVLAMRRS